MGNLASQFQQEDLELLAILPTVSCCNCGSKDIYIDLKSGLNPSPPSGSSGKEGFLRTHWFRTRRLLSKALSFCNRGENRDRERQERD